MRLLPAMTLLLFATKAQAEQLQPRTQWSSERVTCSIAAGVKFGVPVNIVLAVAEIEGGRPGQWVRNTNGTYDVGPLQFNTRYLEHLQRHYGITAADVAAAGCYSYQLAAWRLRKHLELDRGDRWTRVANYHSRSPAENGKYREKLMRSAAAWARWLYAHVATSQAEEAQLAYADIASQPLHPEPAPRPRARPSIRIRASVHNADAAHSEDDGMLRELMGDDAELPKHESPTGRRPRSRAGHSTAAVATEEDTERSELLELLKE